MTLSVYVSPHSSPMDIYAVYVSFGTNETLVEFPTESKFDFLFILPNKTDLPSTSDVNSDDQYELKHTIFMPPNVHLGNGTYIFGVKLISKCSRRTTYINDKNHFRFEYNNEFNRI
jgi:hypothetical protein